MPIEVSHLITNAWKSNQPAVAEKGSIVMSLQPDGSAKEPPSVHPIQGEQKDFIGVFDVSFVSTDRVKVRCDGSVGPDIALVVDNSGSPEDLERQVDAVWEWIATLDPQVSGAPRPPTP